MSPGALERALCPPGRVFLVSGRSAGGVLGVSAEAWRASAGGVLSAGFRPLPPAALTAGILG